MDLVHCIWFLTMFCYLVACITICKVSWWLWVFFIFLSPALFCILNSRGIRNLAVSWRLENVVFTIKIKFAAFGYCIYSETKLNMPVYRSYKLNSKLVSLFCRRRRFRPASGKTSPRDSPRDACSPTSQSQS